MDGFFTRSELSIVQNTPTAILPDCGRCGLLTKCQSPKMPVAGHGKRGVMVIAEAPGETEDLNNKPLIGKAGQRFQQELRAIGVEMFRDCWVTNALRCRPPGNVIDTDKKIDYCRPLALQAIEKYKPRVVLLLGLTAIKSIIGHLWLESLGNMNRWLGWQIPCQKWQNWLIPTMHPSYLLRQHGDILADREFTRSIRSAFAISKRPSPLDWLSGAEAISNPDAAAKRITQMRGIVAWDIETTCLKPSSPHAEIVCCSVSNGTESISFPWHGAAVDAMLRLLKSDQPNIGYNTKFETEWMLVKHRTRVRNWVWDGMIAAHALDSRSSITGLEFQEFVQFGIRDHKRGIKEYLKGKNGNSPNRIREIPWTDLAEYSALDSLVEYKVAEAQMQQMGRSMEEFLP